MSKDFNIENLSDAFLALRDIDDEEVKSMIKPRRKMTEGRSYSINSSNDELEDAKSFLHNTDKETALQVIDPDADTIEHIKKKEDYVGQVILQCEKCGAKRFIDLNKLVVSEGDEDVYNVEDECPNCKTSGDGYEIIGQVGKVEQPEAEPVAVEEEPVEEPESSESEEAPEASEIALPDSEEDNNAEEASFDNDQVASEEPVEDSNEEEDKDFELPAFEDTEEEPVKDEEEKNESLEEDSEEENKPKLKLRFKNKLEESFIRNIQEGLTTVEFKELLDLCDKIGIETIADLRRFKKENAGEILRALRDYAKKIGKPLDEKVYKTVNDKSLVAGDQVMVSDNHMTHSRLGTVVDVDVDGNLAVDLSGKIKKIFRGKSPMSRFNNKKVFENMDEELVVAFDNDEVAPEEEAIENNIKPFNNCVEQTATEVMAAYQNSARWLDTIKESVYYDLSCPVLANYIHEIAHKAPREFDAFGSILHTANIEIPYPATEELEGGPENIAEAIDATMTVLDLIKEKLNAFIECTDKDYHGMSCSAEELLVRIDAEYPMLYRMLDNANKYIDDTVAFEKYLLALTEHKEDLLD